MNNKEEYAEHLKAVRRNGYMLMHVPDRLIDEALCLEAVQRSGGAIKWVPDQFMSVRLCLAAVEQDAAELFNVPKEYFEVAEVHLKLVGGHSA